MKSMELEMAIININAYLVTIQKHSEDTWAKERAEEILKHLETIDKLT